MELPWGNMLISINNKNCLRPPVPEIQDAARLLDSAVTAHFMGNHELAEELIRLAYMSAIREWTESIWGSGGIYSELKKKLGKPTTIYENVDQKRKRKVRELQKKIANLLSRTSNSHPSRNS